jgi:flagellar protein FliS
MVAYYNPTSFNTYKQQTAKTASPGELTLMLYDGCIKFMKQSKLFMEEQNFSKSHETSMKAQKILNELMATLDMKYEISTQLSALYHFMQTEIKASNVERKPEKLPDIIDLMTELRDTWQEAVKINRKESLGSVPTRSGSYEA